MNQCSNCDKTEIDALQKTAENMLKTNQKIRMNQRVNVTDPNHQQVALHHLLKHQRMNQIVQHHLHKHQRKNHGMPHFGMPKQANHIGIQNQILTSYINLD